MKHEDVRRREGYEATQLVAGQHEHGYMYLYLCSLLWGISIFIRVTAHLPTCLREREREREMNLIRKEVITSLPVSLAYLFSITAAYAQTVQAFTLQNLVWRERESACVLG